MLINMNKNISLEASPLGSSKMKNEEGINNIVGKMVIIVSTSSTLRFIFSFLSVNFKYPFYISVDFVVAGRPA